MSAAHAARPVNDKNRMKQTATRMFPPWNSRLAEFRIYPTDSDQGTAMLDSITRDPGHAANPGGTDESKA
jgi:hypothetical protein